MQGFEPDDEIRTCLPVIVGEISTALEVILGSPNAKHFYQFLYWCPYMGLALV